MLTGFCHSRPKSLLSLWFTSPPLSCYPCSSYKTGEKYLQIPLVSSPGPLKQARENEGLGPHLCGGEDRWLANSLSAPWRQEAYGQLTDVLMDRMAARSYPYGGSPCHQGTPPRSLRMHVDSWRGSGIGTHAKTMSRSWNGKKRR